MALPYDGWEWWGEEGGMRFVTRRDDRGFVLLAITEGSVYPTTELARVTLAPFRLLQLRDWLNQSLPAAEEPEYLADGDDGALSKGDGNG